jgi:hypothetical protein
MHKLDWSKVSKLSRTALVAGLLFPAGVAFAQQGGIENTTNRINDHVGPLSPPSGGEFSRAATYVDFSANSTDPTRAFKTMDIAPFNSANHDVVKSVGLQLWAPTGAGTTPTCVEVYTERGSSSTTNADTRMFMYGLSSTAIPGALVPKDTTFTSISDDWGGTVYARARFFIGGPTGWPFIILKITPYSSAANSGQGNSIDFGVAWRRLSATTAAACEDVNTNFIDSVSSPKRYVMHASY